MKKAIIFGCGKIARGFVGQLLYLSDFAITFVDVYQPIIDKVNTDKKYHVHVLGDASLDSVITGISALNFNESQEVFDAFKEADIAFVSVGGKNLINVANCLSSIFELYGIPKIKKNIIVCENWADAANTLKDPLYKNLSVENKDLFNKYIGITEGVLMRTATQPDEKLAQKYPLDVWVQNYWYLPIDRSRLITDIPEIQSIEALDHFGNFLIQKMYTNNTSNAVIAYTGYLLGYEILAEAANSPEISKILDKTYKEINQTLVAELGVDPKDQEEFSKRARKKYCDWTIVDKITRHAKDPLRKLGPKDRLIAPSRMALKHGIYPETLITTIAEALFFDEPTDESAMELKKIRREKGIEYVLKNVCKLDADEVLYQEVLKAVERISNEGLVKNHV
ncbi:mannitol-1-phosphate 5-dehydrogenase [Absicoccus intestinalis]|uniref:Mannitol-1-phosphate 5-dehydrogenase n=1 Tax=Absicoccus intestinalis TaxID=2926319 RepID=A0ABU4WL77_9FIRM|nr:mannitol-1-phosphate 5-dehydrogenase [Absicoccus sp. CLA-KB-P134]MDX8417319.1 mannitol-1-phosphate 5-dehydrogenase [Absicoccus sp. CLA-KB-P134]